MRKYLTILALSSSLFGSTLSQEQIAQLVGKAVEAQKLAYAPYSNYHVGAALLTSSGTIHTGCNVENASYGLTICAERTAVFKLISSGGREIEAVAVVTRDGGSPCGACRQVLNEFNPNMVVVTADEEGNIHGQYLLNELLPGAFGPANLN